MFVQTEVTPNPNSLKFLPGKTVCNNGAFEVTKKEEIDNTHRPPDRPQRHRTDIV